MKRSPDSGQCLGIPLSTVTCVDIKLKFNAILLSEAPQKYYNNFMFENTLKYRGILNYSMTLVELRVTII